MNAVRRFAPLFLALAGTCGVSLADDAKQVAPKPAVAAPVVADALIPRAVLFGNPNKAQGRISPDGKMVSFLAPVNGVLNVWVGPVDDLAKAKPITQDDKRGIRQYFWAYSSAFVLYIQDKGGDENWRVYAVELATGKTTDLTPLTNVAAQIEGLNRDEPDAIMVGLNDREPHQYHDLYKINIRTGERTLVVKNDTYAGFVVDDKFRVRLAVDPTPDGGAAYLKAKNIDKPSEGFEPDFSVPQEDMATTNVVGFSADGQTMYMIDSRGRNTGALFKKNLKSGEAKLVLEDEKTDIAGVMTNPITQEIEAVETDYDKPNWTLIDRTLEKDFYAIRTQAGQGEINVTSRSLDDRFWTVALIDDDGPAKTWLLDRGDLKDAKRKPTAKLLFINKPELAEYPLSPMRPLEIKTRDGMTMMSYLTLPKVSDPGNTGKPKSPLPLVLNVHGGPWARDSFGFDPEAQWLANRGYAVLQVNFRGSTGFGKKFLNAANKEWAGTMHDDLIDSVNWAVEQKIADPKKVAIMGGSYGGYATLVGLTFTPDVFACGIDIVGPSNLNTLLKSIPEYWKPMLESMYVRVGDPRTEEGKKLLEDRSPLNHVEKIKKPLLIGQGANDPRVKQAEADQIVKAMQTKKIPVTYVLYPDEGHGFARPENRMSFNAIAEAFLAQHLGGRAEPIGDALKGSSLEVPAGANGVPGLSGALEATKPGK